MVWVTLNDRLFKQLLHPSMHTSGCHTTLISELKPKFLQLLFFIGWAVSLTQRRRCIPIGPCIVSPHTLCVLTNNNTITKNKAVSHTNTLFFPLNCQIFSSSETKWLATLWMFSRPWSGVDPRVSHQPIWCICAILWINVNSTQDSWNCNITLDIDAFWQ